jgi:hypothetical protein
MCWSIVTFLLVLSLTNSDFVDLVLEVVVAFVLAVQSARLCVRMLEPLATPTATPRLSRFWRYNRFFIWILWVTVLFMLADSLINGRIWETLLFGMLAVSSGIVSISPSIDDDGENLLIEALIPSFDFDSETSAETLTAQQKESVTNNYVGMPL